MLLPLAIACDHAGLPLKAELIRRLQAEGREVCDLGVHSPESTDYPDQARAVGEALQSGRADRGLLICGSGIGMAMAANAMPGVRAVNACDEFQARMARRHNDANVLSLGARAIGADPAWEILKAFLQEPFEGGRHQRRIEKIEALKKERRP